MTASLHVSIVLYEPPLKPGLLAVLQHLVEAADRARHEGVLGDLAITLIDNGDNGAQIEGVCNNLADQNCSISIIRNPENSGYGAHNQAIHNSSAQFHLILNPDVLLETNALYKGLKYLQDNASTVMICPNSRGADGMPSYLCKRYPALLDLFLRGFAPHAWRRKFDDRLMRYEYRDTPVDSPIRAVELISGCCMLARTHALKSCGGFDEKFFLYFEDFDLSLRMRQHGNLDYCPEVQIVHYGGNAASKGLKHIAYFMKSAVRFYAKHGLRVS